MERRRLGEKGPEISVVGYGAWEAGGAQWGEEVEDRRVIEAMDAAIEAGIDWIDTAEAYGDGRSEELVGRVLERHRGDVMVFTKVAPFASGLRRDDVKRAVHASLERLRVEHIDLYQIHWPDEDQVPIEEPWGALAELQDAGLVRHIGVSNCDRGLIERCLAIRHVDSIQNHFSLLHRDDTKDLLPWLEGRGIGYLAYGPLAYGLLTGALNRDTTFDESDWRSGGQNVSYYDQLFAPGAFERNLDVVDRLKPIAESTGVPLSTLALRAAVDPPGVTAAIAGSRNADHVRSNAAAGDLRLDADVLAQIERALSA